tara:strand:- start:589 stop:816 length:228 start_codon:yes stop_codon:yes gene_type:complete
MKHKGQSSTHSTRGIFGSRFHLSGGFWWGVGDLFMVKQRAFRLPTAWGCFTMNRCIIELLAYLVLFMGYIAIIRG